MRMHDHLYRIPSKIEALEPGDVGLSFYIPYSAESAWMQIGLIGRLVRLLTGSSQSDSWGCVLVSKTVLMFTKCVVKYIQISMSGVDNIL